jgi:hypothetical protein
MRFNNKNPSNLAESDRLEHHSQTTFQVYELKLQAIGADGFAVAASALGWTLMCTNLTNEPGAEERWRCICWRAAEENPFSTSI